MMDRKKGNTLRGTTDQETTEDLFELDSYRSGLSKFILQCNTPMTIAIQGSWGSGKSSMMKMVKQSIREEAVCIEFNTWEYSQFNLGENLPLIFFNSLIEKSSVNEGKKVISDVVKKTAIDTMKNAAVIGADRIFGSKAAELLDNVLDYYDDAKKGNGSNKTMVQAIESLKNGFCKIIKERCSDENKNRVVFFIDDLDRLAPQKAVELMEILKIILECEQCVFVLAIDYDVVSRGVREKYGEDIDEAKGRSFFDKIIQVPFSLPVGRYNIAKYIKELLKASELNDSLNCIKNPDSDDIDQDYLDIVKYSIGCNPRSIKRLVNTFSLLLCIVESNAKENFNKDNYGILFATLCVQLAYEHIYDYMLEKCKKEDELQKLLAGLDSADSISVLDDSVKEVLKIKNLSEMDINNIVMFFDKLTEIIERKVSSERSENLQEEQHLSREGIKILRSTLQMAAITATTLSNESGTEEFDTKINDIFNVTDKVMAENRNGVEISKKHIIEAMKCVAGSRQSSCVTSECTRGLKISSEEFYDYIFQFLKGNRDTLIETVIKNNKNKNISDERIRNRFLSIE